eukprot:scaffold8371_cov199-Amphora_coffeaeformis.AAC.7
MPTAARGWLLVFGKRTVAWRLVLGPLSSSSPVIPGENTTRCSHPLAMAWPPFKCTVLGLFVYIKKKIQEHASLVSLFRFLISVNEDEKTRNKAPLSNRGNADRNWLLNLQYE